MFSKNIFIEKKTPYQMVLTASFVQSEVTYDTYQHVPVESFAEVLLRTGKLAETKTEGEEVFPTTEGMKEGSSSPTVCNLYQENNR